MYNIFHQGIESACVLHYCTCLLKDPSSVPRSAAVDAVEEAQQLLTQRHAALYVQGGEKPLREVANLCSKCCASLQIDCRKNVFSA